MAKNNACARSGARSSCANMQAGIRRKIPVSCSLPARTFQNARSGQKKL